MRLDELERLVAAEITDAAGFIDHEVGAERALASRYYRGELFGDEEDGRSKVVSRDVADVVGAILPSLLRVFFGPEKVVEFAPHGAEDVAGAEQATDYVNYIVERDNPGFEVLHAAFKDALIRKVGIVKWWWDDSATVTSFDYTGLDELALESVIAELSADGTVEVSDLRVEEAGIAATLKVTRRADQARFEAVPPEEFLIDRRARSIEDATIVAHRRMISVSDLVAMGYAREVVEPFAKGGDEMAYNAEVLARGVSGAGWPSGASDDPAGALALYVEAYIKADVDGDGIAELVKVCTLGPDYRIVHHAPADERRFAAFHCDPEPHAFFGASAADRVMDIQRVKSSLLRGALDSLALSLNPRMLVREGRVNIDDVMNAEVGAIIRADDPGAVTPLVTPDVSASAYAALTYMDQVKEARTGMSRAAQGLDPEALQTMTATAASAQFSQSRQQIELIARTLAETGMKRLFRGLLRLVVQNQRRARMVRLSGAWVRVDPQSWREDMDVTCNVALGSGSLAERAQMLSLILREQKEILRTLGPSNPMVGLPEVHNALSQALGLAGFRNPDAYFRDPRQAPPPPQDPPGPDAETLAAAGRLDLERRKLFGELALKREVQAAELALKREALAAEAMLRREQAGTGLSSDIGDVRLGGAPG